MQRFEEGFLIGGRNLLESFVASGGMGDVWRLATMSSAASSR
ncbi:MAG: hypothetical protein ABR500_12660 [Dermatophilaceae bacterium]